MSDQSVEIPGLAGPVTVRANIWTGQLAVSVGGVPVRRVRRAEFALPLHGGGEVAARVKSTLFNPIPRITVGGSTYSAGPVLPGFLKVLLALPLWLIVIGGLLGGACGAGGVAANMAIAQSRLSTPVKTVAMLGVLLGTALGWLILVTVFALATSPLLSR